MKDFSLIRVLQQRPDINQKIRKITYQRYDVPVDGKETGILIPIRECAAFEASIDYSIDTLTEATLKKVLRVYRGIRARE